MCGIIGVTGTGPVVPRLIDSLKRLESVSYTHLTLPTSDLV